MSLNVFAGAKWVGLCLLFALLFGSQAVYAQERAEISIDYFGLERGYTVGGQPVGLLCVVRNKGKETLPANQLRLRLNTIQGLDYTQGELRPVLPKMGAGHSLSFRWILSPLSLQANLIASVVLEKAPALQEASANSVAAEPQMVVSLLTRFMNSPVLFTPNLKPSDPPRARANGVWWIGNDRVGVQVQLSSNRNPTLFLQGRVGKEWQTLAFAPLLAEVRSAEDGQVAWAEAFRVGSANVSNEVDGATLNLLGAVGKRWSAEVQFTIAPSTGAVQGRLRLTAKRTMRVFSIRLPLLIGVSDTLSSDVKADGKPIPVAPFVSPIEEKTTVSALLTKSIVYGVAWTNTAPIPDWHWERTSIGDPLRAPLLGVMWLAPEKGDIISAGATLDIPFRLLAVGESQSTTAASPFALP